MATTPKTDGQTALEPERILATIERSGLKRTPQRAVAVAQALQVGATKEAAAAHAGIDDNTLYRWMRDDPAFASLVAAAEAAAEMTMTTAVYRAVSTDPKMAAWWLERRRPKQYGRRDRMDVTHGTRELARSIAEEHGLDEDAVIARAQEIVAAARERSRRGEPEGE